MNPFRKNVLVLFGAALLVALSVSSALGAKPTDSDSGPRGQTISAFVHALIAGDQEVTVDESSDEAPADEETSSDEDTSNEEDSTPADENTSDSSTDANAHGKCVSEIAQNSDEIGGDNENHGGAVSLAARETCRDEAADEAADTAADDDVQAEMTAREEAAAARAAAKEARMADKGEKAAARDAGKVEQATAAHGKSGSHGGGHGH